MIDKNELKRLAEAAIQDGKDNGERWPQDDDWFEPELYGAIMDYVKSVSPATILSLLSEIEGLHAQHGRDSAELRELCSARDDARKERDSLKAENESLSADEREAADLCDRLSDLLRSTAIEVRGPEEPLKRHSFHDIPLRVKAVVSERDQLRADNERQAKEIEALRKDAERISFIEEEWFYVTQGDNQEFCFVETWSAPGATLREAIDAAMSKGDKA